jgi:hypothetical protein
MAKAPLLLALCALALSIEVAGQEVDVGLVAQISTYAYDDALNRGGLSFETKDGNDLLQVHTYLIASVNFSSDNRSHIDINHQPPKKNFLHSFR